MYELLNIEVKDGKQLVSARELHKFLEVKTEFRHWFPRMCEYGFIENIDYTPVIFEHLINKQQTTDYAMTLDMAKEVSMIQRNEKLIGLRTRTKFNYDKYIKNKMGINRATKEYENVKMVLFAELGVSIWEEIDYSLDVIAKIDEILETLKLDNQLSYIK